MEEKNHKEVIKASGAIHIDHNLTLLQQQTWNVLLANAFPYLEKQDIFEMREDAFLSYFPYATRNTEHFKEILRVLNTTQVEYNIFRKDKSKWGVFTLLAHAQLENGICSYSYAPPLLEKLKDPAIYAKINLLTQSRFDSKYSLFLYELCVDYQGVGQTPWMELDQFRKYMGLKPEEYAQFKILNRDVLKVSVREINKKSDLALSVNFEKEKKRVVALKFLIEQNQHKQTADQLPLPLTLPVPPTAQRLLGLGVSPRQAKQLSQHYTEEQIEQAIRILEAQEKKVRNVGGFLKKALEEAWQQKAFIPQEKKPEINPLQWFEKQDQTTRCVLFMRFQKEHPRATSETHPQEWRDYLSQITYAC